MNKYAQCVQELGGRFLFREEKEPKILSEDELVAVERELDYVLPDDYREFLREFGEYSFWAYCLVNNHSRVEQEDYLGRVHFGEALGCSGTEDRYDLLYNYKELCDDGLIGPELLPIASHDLAGDYICLFLDGERKGSVVFWDGGRPVSPYDYSNIYLIADSFDEFMQVLKPYEEGE